MSEIQREEDPLWHQSPMLGAAATHSSQADGAPWLGASENPWLVAGDQPPAARIAGQPDSPALSDGSAAKAEGQAEDASDEVGVAETE